MDTEKIRGKLEKKLATLTGRVSKIESDLRDPGSKNREEHAMETDNDEVLEGLSEAERTEIGQIQAALKRLGAGTYSTCSECGDEIASARLDALPYATVCIACAS
jgi:RNA polymerase-binding transcription factor DksA